MIEKLDPIKHTDNLYDKNGFITNVACGGVVISKVNELINVVNYLQDHIADASKKVADRMIGCTTLDIPESYKTDPYAEQRQWIGKLCWFWSGNFKQCGILTAVFDNNKYGENDLTEEYPFQRDSIGCWQHCKPVKPDDDIIYKGGDNE